MPAHCHSGRASLSLPGLTGQSHTGGFPRSRATTEALERGNDTMLRERRLVLSV